ncbi:ReoY family proteolytic degradation factor [Virgibacillus sp. W0430]|uniref:ReoY family proteolytic degradation factor n=1 Tax=Virgibacillus sp. W0430 TaxID=3391580 RepID=UPI003F46A79A
MQTIVSTEEKQAFIYWFLRNYQMKKQESEWILKYIAKHRDILKNVHFISSVQGCPRSLKLAATCSEKPAFIYFKQHLTTLNPDKAYHDIRLNNNEKLFIELHFKDAIQNANYALVREDNPYSTREDVLLAADRKRAEMLLNGILMHKKKLELKRKIDEALDNRDDELFAMLAKKLTTLKKNDYN